MSDNIRAPWTPEQVADLNGFQQKSGIHPFTCGNDGHAQRPVLTATESGWICPVFPCGYTQDWAPTFMLLWDKAAEGTSKRAAEAEMYVLLRKAGEPREGAVALIDRHRDEAARPRRGDGFAVWLKQQRDQADPIARHIIDDLLDLYRLHADTGTPLGEHVCEGRVVGDCGCLEVKA